MTSERVLQLCRCSTSPLQCVSARCLCRLPRHLQLSLHSFLSTILQMNGITNVIQLIQKFSQHIYVQDLKQRKCPMIRPVANKCPNLFSSFPNPYRCSVKLKPNVFLSSILKSSSAFYAYFITILLKIYHLFMITINLWCVYRL